MKKNLYLIRNGKIIRKQNTLYFISKKENSTSSDSSNGSESECEPGYFEDEEGECSDFSDNISDKPEFEKRPLAVEQIDAIICYGRISLTSGAISFLSKYNIPVHFFGYYGNYESTLLPKETLLSGEMHVRQASHYLDKSKRIILARKIVLGSASNIKRNLEYYQNQEKPLKDIYEKIETLSESAESCEDIGQLLALEGNIRNTYYSSFDTILKPEFSFEGRSRHPPTNPLNAMISFGNSLLYSQVINALYRTQLDQTISFLHEPSERRFSLALDISEIFKPLLVDRVIFKLVNKDMISPQDFNLELNSCLLNERGKRLFIEEFNNKLETTIKHRDLGRNVSYGRLIYLECIKLSKHIIGIKDYKPFIIWW